MGLGVGGPRGVWASHLRVLVGRLSLHVRLLRLLLAVVRRILVIEVRAAALLRVRVGVRG